MSLDDIKMDEKSIYLLCNSLNAWYGAVLIQGKKPLADLILRAQATIMKLHAENKALKEGKKE